MMRLTVRIVIAIGALALTTGVEAQRPRGSAITISRGEFSVAPYGGYLVTQNFINGPLDTSLGTVNAPVYGVQASLPLAPSASLVGAIGYSSGDLEVGVPFLGGLSVGNSTAWVFDASVELRAESWQTQGKRVVPLVHLGGGAISRELSVLGVSARSTDFMVSGGVGADLPVTNSLAVRLMVKDHYGKADFGSLGPVSAKTDDLHTIALTAGMRFSF
jgi:hypothetical protein